MIEAWMISILKTVGVLKKDQLHKKRFHRFCATTEWKKKGQGERKGKRDVTEWKNRCLGY